MYSRLFQNKEFYNVFAFSKSQKSFCNCRKISIERSAYKCTCSEMHHTTCDFTPPVVSCRVKWQSRLCADEHWSSWRPTRKLAINFSLLITEARGFAALLNQKVYWQFLLDILKAVSHCQTTQIWYWSALITKHLFSEGCWRIFQGNYMKPPLGWPFNLTTN